MGVAPGGKIKQVIKPDTYPNAWLLDKTTTFNVQILNAASFERVTGHKPPPSSLDAKTYAEHGYPFYRLDEEKSSIFGNFGDIKSVGQMDGKVENELEIEAVQIAEKSDKTDQAVHTELTNSADPSRPFRSWRDMKKRAQEH